MASTSDCTVCGHPLVCSVCGEPLTEEHSTVKGKPVCTDAEPCVRRWYDRAKIRRMDPVTHVETR